jgi:recombination protein RecA
MTVDRFSIIRARISKATKDFKIQIAEEATPVEFISTGVRALDRITHGGLPLGRIVEVYGPYSSGKTLLCQSLIVQVQKLGAIPLYIDREHAYDKTFAAQQGVDNTRLFFENELKTIEDIFDYMMRMIQKIRAVDKTIPIVILLDSVAAANTKRELSRPDKMKDQSDLPLWDKDQGYRAKMIGEGCRKLTGIMDRRTLVVIVNQVRSKVGVRFGNPEVTPGGQALPFVASLRIRLEQGVLKHWKHKKHVMSGGTIIGSHVVCNVTKSKVGPPFRKCEIVQSFEIGFLEWPGLYEVLVDEGVIVKDPTIRGGFLWGKIRGRDETFIDWVREHPEVLDEAPVTIARSADDVDDEPDQDEE